MHAVFFNRRHLSDVILLLCVDDNMQIKGGVQRGERAASEKKRSPQSSAEQCLSCPEERGGQVASVPGHR